MENINLSRILKWSVGFLVFTIVIVVLNILSDVLIPFAVAFLLAYLINPLVVFTEKKIKNRACAVFVVLLSLFVVLYLALSLVIPALIAEINRLLTLVDSIISNSELHKQIENYIPQGILARFDEYLKENNVKELMLKGNSWKVLTAAMRKVLPGVWGVISGAASFVFGLFGLTVVLLYLIFILIDYNKVSSGVFDFIPHAYRDSTHAFIDAFNSGMKRYFRAQCLIAFLVGIMVAVGFKIIGLPLAILMGLFIGALNIVPYLQIAGFIPAFMLSLLHAVSTQQNVWGVFGLVVLVVAIVQVIQDVLLVPNIMGKVTGLSPVVILLSLSIWGKLLGFFGLLIAIPATCLLIAYYQKFLKNIHQD